MIALILIALFASSLLTWQLSFRFKKTNIIKDNFILTNIIIAYILILVLTKTYDLYLESVLHSYDLDNDGFFSIDEQTVQQQAALKKVTSDTARNLIPITGVLYSIIYGIFLIGSKKMRDYIKR